MVVCSHYPSLGAGSRTSSRARWLRVVWNEVVLDRQSSTNAEYCNLLHNCGVCVCVPVCVCQRYSFNMVFSKVLGT